MQKIKVNKIYSYQGGTGKGGRGQYTKKHYKDFQDEVHFQLKREDVDENKPLALHIWAVFTCPGNKSEKTKSKAQGKAGLPATKNIDLDNISKGIQDIYFNKYNLNDKDVTDLHVYKSYNPDPADTSEYIVLHLENKKMEAIKPPMF